MTAPERLNYFQRQILGAADFAAQQLYHRTMRRRHNLGPHGWGVVTGLAITELAREGEADFRDLVVMPGLAVDLFGREILVLEPARVDPSLFAALSGDSKRELWIAYDEQAIRDGRSERLLCEGTDLYSRVRETFRFFAGPQPSTLHDLAVAEVIVGGEPAEPPPPPPADPGRVQLPADSAAPFQEFEAPGVQRRWLVRLGSVRWDGGAGKFRPVADPADLVESRTWAGFFGASLRSESGRLDLAPRTAFADADAQDFAFLAGRLEVAGRLTAKKDVEIHGGAERFQATNGQDEGIPLWAQRRSLAADNIDAELHVHIGDDPASKRVRFSVGSGADATVKPVLAVRADRKVDVHDGKVRFPGPTRRQVLDLSLEIDGQDGAYGIGVQNGAQYARSADAFYWYRGGAHDDTAGTPGAGGSVLLELDGAGRTHFGTRTQQMLNLWAEEYGIGVQNVTLYFRSNFDFAWHRGGTHSDFAGSPGAGGTRLMFLDRNGRLFFDSRTQQTLNLWSDDYGIGVQDSTLYHRSNADFAWFVGGSHSDTRGDAGGGSVAMRFNAIDGLVVSDDIRTTGDLYVRGVCVPVIDVKTGVVPLNVTPAPAASRSGTYTLDVGTSLTSYSTATVMVALSEISNVNVATDARWAVEPLPGFTRLGPSAARFQISWRVDDIDGWLCKFSWIAIFTA